MNDENKLKSLLEQIADEQNALPLDEQQKYLADKVKTLNADLKTWRDRLASLKENLLSFASLNDGVVDEAFSESYLEYRKITGKFLPKVRL